MPQESEDNMLISSLKERLYLNPSHKEAPLHKQGSQLYQMLMIKPKNTHTTLKTRFVDIYIVPQLLCSVQPITPSVMPKNSGINGPTAEK